MRAVQVARFAQPGAIEVREVPEPTRGLGAQVIAVVSSAAKAEVARAAGAYHVVGVDDFQTRTREIHPDGVNCVVDPVGGERFTDSLRCLAPLGRLLVLGFAAGEIPTVSVNRLLLRNIEVVGVGWGGYAYPRPGCIAQQWRELLPLIGSAGWTRSSTRGCRWSWRPRGWRGSRPGRSPARWCLALPERWKSIAATLTVAKASPGRSLGRDVITR